MDSAMPVLPLVHSRIIESGRSSPRCSASLITPAAKRSLMLPLGLRNSHLAKIVTPSGSKCSGTVGVLPIKESTALAREAFTFFLESFGSSMFSVCSKGRKSSKLKVQSSKECPGSKSQGRKAPVFAGFLVLGNLWVGACFELWTLNLKLSKDPSCRWHPESSNYFHGSSQSQVGLHLGKFLNGEFQVLPRVRGRDLGANARLALGHDRVGKPDDIHASLQHLIGRLRGQRR